MPTLVTTSALLGDSGGVANGVGVLPVVVHDNEDRQLEMNGGPECRRHVQEVAVGLKVDADRSPLVRERCADSSGEPVAQAAAGRPPKCLTRPLQCPVAGVERDGRSVAD